MFAASGGTCRLPAFRPAGCPASSHAAPSLSSAPQVVDSSGVSPGISPVRPFRPCVRAAVSDGDHERVHRRVCNPMAGGPPSFPLPALPRTGAPGSPGVCCRPTPAFLVSGVR
jgi:hypothetical protein